MPRQKPYHKHLRTITTTGFAKTKPCHKHLQTITTTGLAKTKTLPQAAANYHHHGFCQDKNLTTSTCEPSPPRVLPSQKPYHKHLRTITTTGSAKTRTLPQAPANYHHHRFCQDKNLTTSTCELSPPRVLPRQKPYHKHLRTSTTTGFAKTQTLPQAPANYHHHGFAKTKTLSQAPENNHHHGFCQDKKLSTSTCELSPRRVLPRQKTYHKHRRTITTTGFAKTNTLPQAPANYHHHGLCQDKNLTTSTGELSPPQVLPSTCELSPPRVLPRQKTFNKHLRTITATGFAKTKTLPQAPANYHHHGFCQDKTLPQAPANCQHHGFCQDKKLTTSTCVLSPPRVLPRQKPYHKHLRTVITTGFAKTKTLPQAPANYHHHGLCKDKKLTTSTCELSPPRVLQRQKTYHKHLRTVTTTGFANLRTITNTVFAKTKRLTTTTCQLSPPRVFPRQKTYHKHLRTITTTGFAKTKIPYQNHLRAITTTGFAKTETLPQAPASYHRHGFCQDKNLATSTCELSPPRVLQRQKPDYKHLRTITITGFCQDKKTYHKHLRTITTTGFGKTKNLTTSTCELSPPRVLPRQKPYHKPLRTITTMCFINFRTITTMGFAKTKTLPQAPANHHHHGFCQDKKLATSTCDLSPPRVLPRPKTLPQAPASYHRHGFCQDQKPYHKHLRAITATGFAKTKPYHKHLRAITTTGFAKTKTLPQAPANYHHHEFCQDKNLTTSTCELSPPRVLPRQKPFHKHLRTITTTGSAKTKTLPQAPANYHGHGFCQDKNLTTSTCEL